jgi:ATP-dependent Lon protease
VKAERRKSRPKEPQPLPVLPVRYRPVLPGTLLPVFMDRELSIRAAEQAFRGDKQLIVVLQRAPELTPRGPEELYPVGTLARVIAFQRFPDEGAKLLIELLQRVPLEKVEHAGDHLRALPRSVEVPAVEPARLREAAEHLRQAFRQDEGMLWSRLSPHEVRAPALASDPEVLPDRMLLLFVYATSDERQAARDLQSVLEAVDLLERYKRVEEILKARRRTLSDIRELDRVLRPSDEEDLRPDA